MTGSKSVKRGGKEREDKERERRARPPGDSPAVAVHRTLIRFDSAAINQIGNRRRHDDGQGHHFAENSTLWGWPSQNPTGLQDPRGWGALTCGFITLQCTLFTARCVVAAGAVGAAVSGYCLGLARQCFEKWASAACEPDPELPSDPPWGCEDASVPADSSDAGAK